MFKRLSTLVAVGIISMSLVACSTDSSKDNITENSQTQEENSAYTSSTSSNDSS